MESLLKKVTGKKDNSSSADSADAAEKPTPGSVSSTPAHSAKDVIAALNLAPHPEKGFFTETFRDSAIDTATGRAHSTQIYYLLEGESGLSHWHRVRDAVEVWHYYAGAPLRLSLSHDNGEPVRDVVLGSDLWAGERPQVVVERNEWQHAQSLGEWTLVGCSVAPAFTMESFEMAKEGWEPRGSGGGGKGTGGET